MTDGEREKLIEKLRSNQCQRCDCRQCTSDRIVADELERLAAENAELRKKAAILDNLEKLLLPTGRVAKEVLLIRDATGYEVLTSKVSVGFAPDLATALASAAGGDKS